MATEAMNELTLHFVAADGALLSSEQDALDLLGETYGTETDIIVVPVTRFAPGFFDLSTRAAGHFFQKMQNYRMRLVILGDLSALLSESKSLRDFVFETNKAGYHLFASDRDALSARLAQA